MNSILLFVIVVLIASILQAGTGFGFAIMAVPFLILIFPTRDAIQLNIILSIIISILMTYKVRQDIDKGILKRLIKGSITGILPGFLIFMFCDVFLLKLFVSILILVSTALIAKKMTIKQNSTNEHITGALSGFLTTSISMPGPPLMIYFAGTNVEKAVIRSTTFAYFVFIILATFMLQIFLYGIPKSLWLPSLLSIPVIILGMWLGERLFVRLDQHLFQKIIYILLVITGIYLLISTLLG